ncbi:MAG: hypothetical protein US81_C0039G0008 [Parcubacteria group bacterium GW2011_GWE2_38_18]|nr:MAG: hypothetical protein US81_C0039G0008 [Parcubacteria group bacterium GW2011_GWE2_38_18]
MKLTNVNKKSMEQGKGGQACSCPHHKMVPIFVILFGLTFLLEAFEVISTEAVSIVWPIIVIVVGVQQLVSNYCKCCDTACCETKK